MANDHTQQQLSAAASVVPDGAGFDLRPTGPEDDQWVRQKLSQYWASHKVLTRGRVHDAAALPAFCAIKDGEPIGLITYHIEDGHCEIVTHNAFDDSGGVGSCLLAAVRTVAREAGCSRLWLVTTNDNTPALRFYQRRDFDICAFYRDAVQDNRKLKPEIPDQGLDNIALRHEIELEYTL